jgi:hypothetical protein
MNFSHLSELSLTDWQTGRVNFFEDLVTETSELLKDGFSKDRAESKAISIIIGKYKALLDSMEIEDVS